MAVSEIWQQKTKELKACVAKENGYTVEDMNQFEHQALEMESRVICLLGKVAKAAAGHGKTTIDYLKEKCSDLYTADGAVLESREYDDLWAKLKK